MYKKLFLCLLLTTNLYPVEQTESDKLSPMVVTAMILGAAIIGLDIYVFVNSDQLEKLISGDEKTVAEVITKIITIIGAVYTIPKLYPISKEIYEYTFPTEEQRAAKQADEIAAHEKLKYLKAEEKFFDCLMKHKSGCDKHALGRPHDCEELAQMFIAVGGSEEVARITHDLKEFWK